MSFGAVSKVEYGPDVTRVTNVYETLVPEVGDRVRENDTRAKSYTKKIEEWGIRDESKRLRLSE